MNHLSLRLSLYTLMVTLFCASSAIAGIKVGDPASDFSLTTRGSNAPTTLSGLQGQVVLVNFWASWCGPCRQEFPLLDTIYKKYKKLGLTIVGLNVEPEPADAEAFLKTNPVSFPIVYDPKDEVSRRYGVVGMPSVVLIDRKGVVRWTHKSYVAGDENEYLNQIRVLLAEKS